MFYCGLLRNIPQVNAAVRLVLGSGEALIAGRCLVSVREVPTADLVEEIIELLFEPVKTASAFRPELEILSSLAQRPHVAFDPARRRFFEAIDLVVGTDQGGSAGLVSTLSTRPDLAMRLIPALLSNESDTWRTAAVTLLHDLGTDDALDELVRIVGTGRAPESAWASVYLANLIRSRNQDLQRRAVLLRERDPQPALWPFDSYFPSRLAIPVIEAIRDSVGTLLPPLTNDCIRTAVEHAAGRAPSRSDQRRWRNVERYMNWNRRRSRVGEWLRYAIIGFTCFCVALFIGLEGWCVAKDKAPLVSARPFRIRCSSNLGVLSLTSAARAASETVGLSSRTKEDLGKIATGDFRSLKLLTANSSELLRDPRVRIQRLGESLSSFERVLGPGFPSFAFFRTRNGWLGLFAGLMAVPAMLPYRVLARRVFRNRARALSILERCVTDLDLAIVGTAFVPVAILVYSYSYWYSTAGIMRYLGAGPYAVMLGLCLARAVQWTEFPRNKYMSLVRDLRPMRAEPLPTSEGGVSARLNAVLKRLSTASATRRRGI